MPKIYLAKNIKFLRERRKLSQEMAAAELGITRVKLAALELGNTKSPSPEDYLAFSDFYRFSIDDLLRTDLASLPESKLRNLEIGREEYLNGKNLRVLTISVTPDNKENVEYVPIKAKMGYAGGGFADPDFIQELPKFSLPNIPADGTYRIFPGEGDSMKPIPDGSDITGRYLQDWSILKPKTPCIIILKGQQDFVFKLVTLEGQHVLLESLNPDFQTYTVDISDILEVWEFHSYTSRSFPEGQGVGREVKQLVSRLYEKVVQEK